MAQPRTKGVIVANRSRPIPHQESLSCPIPQPQESLSRSIPEESLVEATQSIVSIPVGGEFLPSSSPMCQVLPEETVQAHLSNSQEGCSDIVTRTIKSIGNEWKTFRGEGCFIATRRGVLLTVTPKLNGDIIVQKDSIARQCVAETIINESQMTTELGFIERCHGRREELVLPFLAAFPSPQLLTSLFVIEKADEGFLYRSRNCLLFLNSSSSSSSSCSSCDNFFDNLTSLDSGNKEAENICIVEGEERTTGGFEDDQQQFGEEVFDNESGLEDSVIELQSTQTPLLHSKPEAKKPDQGIERKRRPPTEQFSCNLCERKFRLQGSLTKHIEKVHQTDNSGLPDITAVKPQNEIGLERRVGGSEEVPCPFCNDTFPVITGRSSSHRLRHHLTTVHAKLSGLKEFKDLVELEFENVICTHCGKSYSNQATLKSHIKLMHNEQTEWEACHICGKRFKKGGSTLWGHIRTHEDGGHVCPICGAKFKVKSYLQRHIKSHSPGSKKYECDICGDKFTRPYLVVQHQEFTHRKNLPFKCPECGKCLRSKTFLKIHMRSVHSKEKPFPCEVCGFRSSRVDNLNIHRIKKHHLTNKVRCFCRQFLNVLHK